MVYSQRMLDHFNNPRNVGELDDKDPDVGTGMVGNPKCGDVMRLQVRINGDGVIEEAVFKTFGCGSAIATSSLLTEEVKGKHYSEALKVKNKDIAADLDLPPIKVHCSVLGEDALKDAIKDWMKKHGRDFDEESNKAG